MILLTRLNGETMQINSFQVESVEANPDTRVTLMNGRQIYVRETPDAVREAMRTWFRSLHNPPGPVSAPEEAS
jgi:flagellar protein FlbD